MISARLRDSSGWHDVRILNLSSRGLLVHSRQSPERGSYVEICKDSHRIVARVIWVRQDRFGVRAQDKLPVEAIVTGSQAPTASANADVERRSRPREPSTAERLERSRNRARLIEFASVVAFSVAAATVAFDAVKGSLGRPLAVVSAQLVRHR